MGTPSVRTDARRPQQSAEPPARRIDPSEVDCTPHAVERQVRRVLTEQPGLTFADLVVRRIRGGVCLTGIVESKGADADVCGLARQVAGVDQVLNRLIVRPGGSA